MRRGTSRETVFMSRGSTDVLREGVLEDRGSPVEFLPSGALGFLFPHEKGVGGTDRGV